MTRKPDMIKEIAAYFGRKRVTAEMEAQLTAILLRHQRNWRKPAANVEWLTEEKLDALALAVCEKHQIDLSALKKSYRKHAPGVVVSARKELTRFVAVNHAITWKRLGRYFGGLNHATVIYYFNGH